MAATPPPGTTSPNNGGAGPITPPAPSLTWLGHATARLDLGARLLVDPLGRGRTRAAGPLDGVLITHSHVDHLNRWSLKAVSQAEGPVPIVVPKGAAGLVADLGFASVHEVEPGDSLSIGGAEVHAVETRHDNGRWRKGDRPICVGYVVRHRGVAVHHAGDVDFSDHSVFDAIGKRFALDATLLPIGGMMPVSYYRWRRAALDRGIHIDPDCALDIFERLGARTLVPVHWGTVNLRLSPSAGPKRRLVWAAAQRARDAQVAILAHGEQLPLAPG